MSSSGSVGGNVKNLLRSALLVACVAFAGSVAIGQTKPAFEVASIKPSAPLDMAKLAAGIQNGQMPRLGAHIDPDQAQYTYMTLKQLIASAYDVKAPQITGPDWLDTERFDIVAKIPEGSSKDEAPVMLQSLLEDRFKLTIHRETKDQHVLALVVGKGGPKMKESTETPQPIDPSVPLKTGEMQMDTPDGPARMSIQPDGHVTVNMGAKGTMIAKVDPVNRSMEMESTSITMPAFADMLGQFSQMQGGGGGQVVDMTGLKGSYDVTIQFPMEDLINMMRSTGMAPPMGAGGPPPADAAAEPGGTSSLAESVAALGLKLEARTAPVEQLVIDHMEKAPSDN
jgi:uncharacterized protein (TIGR03435 family)